MDLVALSWLWIGTVGLSLRLAGSLASLAGILAVVYAGMRMWKSDYSPLKGDSRGITGTTTTRRNRNGDAKIVPIWVMVAFSFLMVVVPVTIAVAKYMNRFPVYELQGVEVISAEESADPDRPGYRYWMEYRSESVGKLRFIANFCPDYKPPFDPGDYLNILRYEDQHSCWSIKSDYAGVVMRRDAEGRTDSERARQTTKVR